TPVVTDSTILLGGQGAHVALATSGVAYDGAGEVFSFDAAVTNLIAQPLGTADGATPHADGVRVVVRTPPVTTGGVGSVSILGADGTAEFTEPGQAYHRYAGVLPV